MTGAPYWFLDVDGVINCFPQPKSYHVAKFGEYKNVQVGVYQIWPENVPPFTV